MKTKEKILEDEYNKKGISRRLMIQGYVFSAMDEYAKEVAIDFAKWLDQNCDENDIHSDEHLFDLYQQEKSSLK